MATTTSSKQIQTRIDQLADQGTPYVVASVDGLTLWQMADGVEVIETNGEPVWQSEDEFEELRNQILPA
jgi:hypothetical protein